MSTQQENHDKYDQVFFKVRKILEDRDYKAFNMFIDHHIKTRDVRILHTILLGMHHDKNNQHVSPKYRAVHNELKKRTNAL